MRRSLLLCALTVAYFGGAVSAAEITGAAGISSDYVWRGISQTDNQIAISAEVESDFGNGFYLGAWGSNVNYGPGDPSLELDLYGGYTGRLGYDLSYDVGLIHYEFPGANDLQTQELYVGLGYERAVVTANYTNDYFGSGEDAWYLAIGTGVPLPADLELQLHLGRSDGAHFDQVGLTPYTDYRIGVSKSYERFIFDLSYTDNDLSDAECTGTADTCDGRAVASVKMDF